MQIAIVDDEKAERQNLRQQLDLYFGVRHIEACYHEYVSGEALLAAAPTIPFDVLFLDIYMDGINGMDTARQLVAQRSDRRIIFLTTSHDHAVESYDVHAAYYLTKPLSPTRLCAALDHMLQEILAQRAVLQVTVNRVVTTLRLQHLLYVDCLRKRARLHLVDQTLEADDNISELVERLSVHPRFVVCNRGIVVNLEWVEDVSQHDFVLKNGERLPIKQRGRGELKRQFLEFSLARLRQEEHP